ncbi:MAG: Membrane metalloprotease [uncultured Solirubrobacteraceae bacterium]|uniref:Membrane metalloprotease n=1 Tax=uncultured Solirubrobacteraceae bacterium TaxID=1162706 RepID=A0A6J4TCD7_9ACTN|nr:MAG: Membrane metalloprotease [uncultured Solirubrobacteraceae bacterium]
METTPPQWLPPTPPPSRPLTPAAETARPASLPAPGGPRPAPSGLRKLFGPLILVGLLLLKFGAKLKVLLLLLPKLKLFTTSASMLLSVGAYALIWGFPFAVGFVALLFVHEMGHYIQLRREGVKPSGMLFIPFLGAVIGAKSLGGSAIAEARVGLAGPVLGSLAAAALIPVAAVTGNEMFQALAFTGFFLNLFNLLPVVPLDGGRAMAAMAPWMWFLGIGLLVALAFAFPNPILLLILLFGVLETYRRWKTRRSGEEGNAAYYEVRPAHRLAVAGVYLGLIALLLIGMDATFIDRSERL